MRPPAAPPPTTASRLLSAQAAAAYLGVLQAVLEAIDDAGKALSGRAIKELLAESTHSRDAIEGALRLGAEAGELSVTPDRNEPCSTPDCRQCPECPDTQRERLIAMAAMTNAGDPRICLRCDSATVGEWDDLLSVFTCPTCSTTWPRPTRGRLIPRLPGTVAPMNKEGSASGEATSPRKQHGR